MSHNLSEDELRLVIWLREHTDGYGSAFALEETKVARGLGWENDLPRLRKAAMYLKGMGLVGADESCCFDNEQGPVGFQLLGISFEVRGEAFLRELERQPKAIKRITIASIVWLLEHPEMVAAAIAAVIRG